MASLVVSPDLLEFWDRLSYRGNEGVNLEQVNYDQITSDDRKCTILDLNIRQQTGCTIIGYKSPDGQYEINPNAETTLEPGSKLIVLGNNDQIEKLRQLYHEKRTRF
jgi:voltage-gated potassium channel